MYADNSNARTASGTINDASMEPNEDGEEDIVDPSFLSFVEDQADEESFYMLEYEEDPTPDLYGVLGVSRDATDADLKAAYRRFSRLLHPDKHSDSSDAAEAAFRRLTNAYNILSDPNRRAIYDQYGFRGLRTQGWELAVRDKSAAELRLEYILLKQKAKESEREHLLQPSTELTCGIDMTDFFDRYLKESPEERIFAPSISVHDVSMSQSITALRTPNNTVNLAGHVTAYNGIGIGTLLSIWTHRFSPKTPIIGASSTETTISYGRGKYGLGLGFKLNKELFDRVSGSAGLQLASAPHSGSGFVLVPGASIGTAIQLTSNIITRLSYKFNMNAGLFTELFMFAEQGKRSCRVQMNILASGNTVFNTHLESTVSWPFLNPLLKVSSRPSASKRCADWETNLDEEDDLLLESIPSKGRISANISCNSYDLMEVRVGTNCALSELTRLSSEIAVSWVRGLSLKLGLHRGNQSYVFPIKLSEVWDPAALCYGILVPNISYVLLRSLVYEPWVLSQLKKAQDIRRKRLRNELRQLRGEALATQALMQHTASRILESERESRGLVIVRALYGQLSSTTPGIPLEDDAGGSLSLDVSVALQVMVENHAIRLPPGRWADLQGFYDPCAGLGRAACAKGRPLRQLFIAYTFNGLPHEVCTEESRGLAIPMSKHRVEAFSQHM
nr:dnaJ subfamily C 1 [Hymenolepis microstoma]